MICVFNVYLGLPTYNQPILAQEQEQSLSDIPVVNSAALSPNLNIPWSEPVKVNDPFEGEFIAIFDRNYFNEYFINSYAKINVVSLWRSDSIRFLLVYSDARRAWPAAMAIVCRMVFILILWEITVV